MSFRFIVNYGDPRWKEFPYMEEAKHVRREDYGYINPRVDLQHFPVNSSGTHLVTCELVALEKGADLQTIDILRMLDARGMRRPDRAETETFAKMARNLGFWVAPTEEEMEPPTAEDMRILHALDAFEIVGLCSDPVTRRFTNKSVSFIRLRQGDLELGFAGLWQYWGSSNEHLRFLATKK